MGTRKSYIMYSPYTNVWDWALDCDHLQVIAFDTKKQAKDFVEAMDSSQDTYGKYMAIDSKVAKKVLRCNPCDAIILNCQEDTDAMWLAKCKRW
jgi:hypothetical protein